jgi:hypothetical protein
VIVSYASGARRRVVLADANPAIYTLPSATVHALAQARQAGDRTARAGPAGRPAGWRSAGRQPPPNPGRPPEPPGWRPR